MKKTIFTAITIALISTTTTLADITIISKNQPLQLDVPPILQNGRTLVPVASISTSLGAQVEWNNQDRTVTITKDGSTITLQLGNKQANINGQTTPLDVPAQAINGRTMVPLSFIATAFGSNIQWDSKTQTVYIDTDPSLALTPETNAATPETTAPNLTTQQTTDNQTPPTPEPAPVKKIETTYIGNAKTKKFHNPGCSSVDEIYESNKVTLNSREEAINQGYQPCKKCHP